MDKELNSKRIYIELLRIIAVYFVISQHSVSHGATLYSMYSSSETRYYVYMFVSMISVFSVPVFFMISGVNLLAKGETVGKQIKRIARCVVILFIFQILYYLENQLKYGDGTLSVKQFFLNMYTSEANGFHLWYMYAYICFLMILPFLRGLARYLNDKHYAYLLVLALVFTEIIPGVEMKWGVQYN